MPEKGCHGLDEWVTGYETDCCPVMYVGDFALAFEAHRFIDKALPYSGGSLEQPVAMMEAIGIIEAKSIEHSAKIGR